MILVSSAAQPDLYGRSPGSTALAGDEVLWSATVVYAACRDVGLIRPGKGGTTPLAQEIDSFFDLEPSIDSEQGDNTQKISPGYAGSLNRAGSRRTDPGKTMYLHRTE